jgi:hypothetical protein
LYFKNKTPLAKSAWKIIFRYFLWKELLMSDMPNASNEQKPVTPPTPQQQTQNTPPKPADKPSEQAK